MAGFEVTTEAIGGALWDLKQLPGLFKNTRVDSKLRYQHVITHLVDVEELIVFTPNQVSLESESGKTLNTRIDPRSAFAGPSADCKWDKLHAGYFSSYALSSTPTPASMRERLTLGMRTGSVGAC